MDVSHIPVLLKEAIDGLNIQKGKKYIDATVGGGGHSEEIIKKGGELLGVDCDSQALDFASKHLEKSCPLGVYRWKLIKGNFLTLKDIAIKENFYPVSGVLFDLGVSSFQLEIPERGFSFNKEGPLDMRMDKDLTICAADLVNALSKNELEELFFKYGEEFHARAIAKAIVDARALGLIKSCSQLVKIISRVVYKRYRGNRIHPATRVFQALRICVNDELNNLKITLPQALDLLEKDGRLVVISFHSLEDRIVKNFFKDEEKKQTLLVLTKKPMLPKMEETRSNPRSRSAKLRIAQKK